jgi:putative DNA-invertase from lambdoid prophage Rac
VLSMLALDRPIAAIARETGLTRQTVYRIQSDPAQAAAALTAWERGQ